MERERGTKAIAIVALLVAVVGLTLGFAAFTRELNISSTANVTPENNLSVLFSTSNSEQIAGTVSGDVTKGYVEGAANNPSADSATIAADGSTTISGLKAKFTNPGQTVTYTFYAHNDGAFDAYLTNITFKQVSGTQELRTCNLATGTTEAYGNAACQDITIKVEIGEGTSLVSANDSTTGISGHKLAKGAFEKVVVTIDYPAGSDMSDGDFDVTFGDLTLTYSTVDN